MAPSLTKKAYTQSEITADFAASLWMLLERKLMHSYMGVVKAILIGYWTMLEN